MDKFTSREKKILILCFVSYVLAYLMRVNISVALPDIMSSLSLSKEQTGIITSAFFWTYAAGQLFSGILGDRLDPKYMILTGLSGSIVASVVFSQCGTLTALCIVWAVNGVFQSMLWAPTTKALTVFFSGDKLTKAMFFLSFSLVAGYAISWLASKIIASFLSWRFVFIIPAAVSLIFCIYWCFAFEKCGKVETEKDGKSEKKLGKAIPTILIICIICALHGAVKESVNVWLPTLLEDCGGFSLSSALGVLAVSPAINFAGILIMKKLYSKKPGKPFDVLSLLFIVSTAVAGIAAALSANLYATVVTAILTCGMMYAVNPLLTGFVPITFKDTGRVSTVAGISDCAIYIGAAIAEPITGSLLDSVGWTGVTAMWAVVLAAGIIFTFIASSSNKKYRKSIEKEVAK